MACKSHHPTSPALDVAALLAEHRPTFLAFVERRVKNRSTAEDLLQEAFVRSMHHAASLREEGALVGWFYRILRNAVVDHYRGSERHARRFEQLANDLEALADPEPRSGEACHCIAPLAQALKPEYAAALASIDVEGTAVKDFAEQIGISPSNAGVRVHRARHALKSKVMQTCGACAASGCGECTCAAPQSSIISEV